MISLAEDSRMRKMAALFERYREWGVISMELTFEAFLKWAEAAQWQTESQRL